MFTIRNLVERFTQKKAAVISESYISTINTTSFCIVFNTLNGTEIFIDMHPEIHDADYRDSPNKNGIFKKFNFTLTKDNGTDTSAIHSYISVDDSLYFENVPERQFNEFIAANGGIDTKELEKTIYYLWGRVDNLPVFNFLQQRMDHYLTAKCKNCEFWKNDENSFGCACPFPIMECEAYAVMYKEKERMKQ